MSARILVVDDEETAREELCEALRDSGYGAVGVANAREALDQIARQFYDVCISDIRMPGMSGIELLRELEEQSPETLVIMITAYGDLETSIEAMRHGAADYVLKPFLFDDIIARVERLVAHQKLAREVQSLRRAAEASNYTTVNNMVGQSEAMRRINALIAKVAPTSSNVLITGESGTGKELIARAIHENSERKEHPFVAINCAAIPETLLESELFGHTKGAFTGAVGNKEGLLKTAGEGTIFLDELGELPLALQAKLLRAIENREIQPVGSVRTVPIHARIIAATNRDLQQRIEEGKFREDLYYRMAVVEIEVPPLRERQEDIPALAQHFVEKYNRELKRQCRGVHPEALAHLLAYRWKGNIRELENTIERALILSEDEQIVPPDLPAAVRGESASDWNGSLTLAVATQQFESNHIRKAIDICEGNKREAAKLLGVSLSSLYRKLDLKGEQQTGASKS